MRSGLCLGHWHLNHQIKVDQGPNEVGPSDLYDERVVASMETIVGLSKDQALSSGQNCRRDGPNYQGGCCQGGVQCFEEDGGKHLRKKEKK